MANSQAVISLYDEQMWESIRAHDWKLQQCDDCSEFRYPPAANCPHCLSMDYHWKPLKGRGTILSWVIYHRQYFDNFPPPYNVVAVQLDEGPIVMSNLVGPEPEGNWVGLKVEICYGEDVAIGTVPKMRLIQQSA
jgi:uncharacterized OB-fold protein